MTTITPMPISVEIQTGLWVEWDEKADLMFFYQREGDQRKSLFVLLRREQELMERFLNHHLHVEEIYRSRF